MMPRPSRPIAQCTCPDCIAQRAKERDEVKAEMRKFLGPGPLAITDGYRFTDAMVDMILDLAVGVEGR